MKVQFVESCVGERYYFAKGDTVNSETIGAADVPELESFLKDQIKAGHAIEIGGTAAKAERAVKNEVVEKR